MGEIHIPPPNIKYGHPKAVVEKCHSKLCPGRSIGKIIGRAMLIESFPRWGDYTRILDLVEWQRDTHHKKTHRELRLCQFYRKYKGTKKDWIFGQGAGHVKPTTFYKLINKAVTKPDYGTFEDVLDRFIIKKHRSKKI